MEGNAIVASATLDDIADAINAQLGTTGKIAAHEMAEKIAHIGGGVELVDFGYRILDDPDGAVELRIKSIGERGFESCSGLERIDRPQIERVEADSFAYCLNLQQVNLPDVSYIGAGAFQECPVEEFRFDSLESFDAIGDYALAVTGTFSTDPTHLYMESCDVSAMTKDKIKAELMERCGFFGIAHFKNGVTVEIYWDDEEA